MLFIVLDKTARSINAEKSKAGRLLLQGISPIFLRNAANLCCKKIEPL